MSGSGGTHHGPLAGLGAGAAAVLAGAVLILIVARRQLGEVATVAAWALMATLAGAVIGAGVYVFAWLRHRLRNPELLAGRHAARVRAMQAVQAAPEIEAPATPAIDPPREVHLHLNVTPGRLAAIMRHHAEEE